ncbi:response regulator [Marinobacter daepoensis]|uniref:Response regulator transcription factor n=1 Tax=Marinobacter daepoensis TaxID=262077 RepID=A0ABS3BCP5_9GAMM|nr:response regulator [Marinobacter daepoensis]MBN7768636.1 response regulator transcription factor [Marinobacter daepoensis]MBY6032905.1 response regulator [Marinobacter daepoensis]MBY6079373.1 response regulator [Marinobacter daepoensis]
MTSNNDTQTVFVIDDDADVRDSLQWLLESVGLQVQAFEDALAFFDAFDERQSGCIVMDVRMPGLSGINAQKKLPEHNIELPVIMISAHGNVDMAVRALTQGALTFIEKPFDDQVLIDHVHNALEKDRARFARRNSQARIRERYDSLTRRERQVLELIVKGFSNQEAADELGINRKTVEGHRANMMAKMKVDSFAELVQVAIGLGQVKTLDFG